MSQPPYSEFQVIEWPTGWRARLLLYRSWRRHVGMFRAARKALR